MKNSIFRLLFILIAFTVSQNVSASAQTNHDIVVNVEVYEDKLNPSAILSDDASISIENAENIAIVDIYFQDKRGHKYLIKHYIHNERNKNLTIDNLHVRKLVKNLSNGKFLIVLKDRNDVNQSFTTNKINKKNDNIKGLCYKSEIYVYDLKGIKQK